MLEESESERNKNRPQLLLRIDKTGIRGNKGLLFHELFQPGDYLFQ